MHEFHYHRFIYTGVKKKRQAFLYGEVCRKIKVASSPMRGQLKTATQRGRLQFMSRHWACQSPPGAAQCKQITAGEGVTVAKMRAPLSQQKSSHSCYGKCSLAEVLSCHWTETACTTGPDRTGPGRGCPINCQFIKVWTEPTWIHKTPLLS